MPAITVQREIAAPPERVFEAFTDLRRAPERVRSIRSVELLSDGPMAAGTRWRETREVLGREATEELEVTDFRPGEGYVVEARSHGTRYRSEFRFEPTGGGTRVTLELSATPLSLAAKLMAPLGKAMMGQVEKACARDLDDLAAALERD